MHACTRAHTAKTEQLKCLLIKVPIVLLLEYINVSFELLQVCTHNTR